jgi:hypothetical protein
MPWNMPLKDALEGQRGVTNLVLFALIIYTQLRSLTYSAYVLQGICAILLRREIFLLRARVQASIATADNEIWFILQASFVKAMGNTDDRVVLHATTSMEPT